MEGRALLLRACLLVVEVEVGVEVEFFFFDGGWAKSPTYFPSALSLVGTI